MGNTVTVNTCNSGVVAPMNSEGPTSGGTNVSVGAPPEEEEEEEIGCIEKLGCLLCI